MAAAVIKHNAGNIKLNNNIHISCLCQFVSCTSLQNFTHQLHPRDHSVYASIQWEMALHSNAVSHWLGAYTEWSLATNYMVHTFSW